MGEGDLTRTSAIRRLRVEHAVPSSAPDPVGLQATVSASIGAPLRHALEARLLSLQERDPRTLWVIRDLDVDVPVPVSLRDPPALAARVAMAVELAIREAIQHGRSATCVRFDSSEAHVAAFVEASMNGAGDTWVFDRLTPARGLAPAAALLVAARLADADLLEVVAEMARAAVWPRFVAALAKSDADRVSAAIRHAHPAVVASTEATRRVRELAMEATPSARLPATAARLALLGRALRELDLAPADVAAVVLSPAPSEWAAPVEPARSIARPAVTSAPSPARSREEGTTFRASGAAAFILATSIADVADELDLAWLVADDDPAAAKRCDMLSRVLGIDADDPAIALAAGLVSGDAPIRVDLSDVPLDLSVPEHDRDWLRAGDSPPIEVALALRLARTFLRRLVGFHSSPLAYVVPRLFGPAGTIAVDVNAISVDIERPPLLVVLQLAGLADFVTELQWLPQPIIIRHEAGR